MAELSLGVPASLAQRLRSLAVAVRDGALYFGVGQDREAFVQAWCAATGLSPQRAQWVALRVLGDPDACPLPPERQSDAAAWRPWRAYAWLYVSSQHIHLTQEPTCPNSMPTSRSTASAPKR